MGAYSRVGSYSRVDAYWRKRFYHSFDFISNSQVTNIRIILYSITYNQVHRKNNVLTIIHASHTDDKHLCNLCNVNFK